MMSLQLYKKLTLKTQQPCYRTTLGDLIGENIPPIHGKTKYFGVNLTRKCTRFIRGKV